MSGLHIECSLTSEWRWSNFSQVLKEEKQMRASELLILTLKQGWIARTSLCKEQIFSWFQSGEWGCEEQSEERPTSVEDLGGHHPRTTSSWTRLLWSSSSCSLQFPGGRRCPCSKWRHFLIFTYIYLCAMIGGRQCCIGFWAGLRRRMIQSGRWAIGGVSHSAWWSSRTKEEREGRPKGKGDTPEGWRFLPPPFGPHFHFFWLTAGESKSEVCLFCDPLWFLSVVYQIPCDQGAKPKHVMSVWEEKIKTNLRFCLLRRPGSKYREIFIAHAICLAKNLTTQISRMVSKVVLLKVLS